jgi:hypothetical protein
VNHLINKSVPIYDDYTVMYTSDRGGGAITELLFLVDILEYLKKGQKLTCITRACYHCNTLSTEHSGDMSPKSQKLLFLKLPLNFRNKHECCCAIS